MSEELTYSVTGATRLDALKLRDAQGVTIGEVPVPKGAYGEPATFTIIVTVAALSTLAGYLLRKHQGEEFEEEIIIQHPTGKTEVRRVRWHKSATEAPEASVIKAIQGR